MLATDTGQNLDSHSDILTQNLEFFYKIILIKFSEKIKLGMSKAYRFSFEVVWEIMAGSSDRGPWA